MLTLDNKLDRSQLKALYLKMDAAQLGDIYITDAKDKFDELTEE